MRPQWIVPCNRGVGVFYNDGKGIDGLFILSLLSWRLPEP